MHDTNSRDEQLMEAIMAGHHHALSILVQRHHQPLIGYLYRMVRGDRELAEDLAQETFVRLLTQGSYQPSRPFKPWLYAIATNLARDHFKAAATRSNVPADRALGARTPVHEWAAAADDRMDMQEALDQLSPPARTVILLRFYQRMSLQEIAETLQIPVGTVKSRLSSASHRLRDILYATQSAEERTSDASSRSS